jgi:hypothetical protein
MRRRFDRLANRPAVNEEIAEIAIARFRERARSERAAGD